MILPKRWIKCFNKYIVHMYVQNMYNVRRTALTNHGAHAKRILQYFIIHKTFYILVLL